MSTSHNTTQTRAADNRTALPLHGGNVYLPISLQEQALINALRAIVLETMEFSPQEPENFDSYLPARLIAQAQAALRGYHCQVYTDWQMKAYVEHQAANQQVAA